MVEIAIVLTVIGLIVAGVLGGQSVIRSAKIQGFIKEIRFYQDAITNFEDKYQSLPGDMPDAENYWGAYDPSDGSGTHNGDGDGKINEPWMAFNHLQQAGFIDSGLTDYSGGGWDWENIRLGEHFPESNIYDDVGFLMCYGDEKRGHIAFHGNFLQIGRGNKARLPMLSPRIAKIIDENLDDGIPDSGRLVAGDAALGRPALYRSAGSGYTDCYRSNGKGGDKYNVLQRDEQCIIAMLLDGELLN